MTRNLYFSRRKAEVLGEIARLDKELSELVPWDADLSEERWRELEAQLLKKGVDDADDA